MLLQRSTDGTDRRTDTWLLHRACSAYYTRSVTNTPIMIYCLQELVPDSRLLRRWAKAKTSHTRVMFYLISLHLSPRSFLPFSSRPSLPTWSENVQIHHPLHSFWFRHKQPTLLLLAYHPLQQMMWPCGPNGEALIPASQQASKYTA